MDLRAEGMRVRLPRSWEGRITRNPARTHSPAPSARPESEAIDRSGDGPGGEDAEEEQLPVAHLANFVLPAAMDDFGAQAVEVMTSGQCFVALLEYGASEAGTPLFAGRLPRRLALRDFSPRGLQRRLPDQLGTQVFATEAGRAFCLYVVLAGRARAGVGVQQVNEVLSTLRVGSR